MKQKINILIHSFVLILLLGGGPLCAQTRSELETQRAITLKEIEATDKLITETQKNQKATLTKVSLLNSQIQQRDRLMRQINSEISLVNYQMTEKQREINKLIKELEFLKDNYAKMIVSAYKHRGRYDAILLILTAKDLNESYRRLKNYQQLSDARIKQVKTIEIKRDTIKDRVQSLKEARVVKQGLLDVQKKEAQNLSSLKTKQQTVANELKKKESQLKKELQATKKVSDDLNKQIEKLIAAEVRKRTPSTKSTVSAYDSLTPEEKLISDKFGDNKGRLPWPTETGIVTSLFGVHPHPVFTKNTISNNGIDITTNSRSLVRAVFEGKVLAIFGIKGGNLTVLIQHGNYFTAYQNLIDVSVKQNENISHKQNIGRVYTDPESGTATLHFELWQNQTKLDPSIWLTPR